MHRPDLAPGILPEAVHVMSDPESGLEGAIVLHSTRLGPAAGGCRFWRYPNSEAATTDALRLAEGMAYKNALADLPLGGGKAVIKMPESSFDRGKLFAAFGREVEKLKGRYVTAEDVGTTVSDMQVVREHCRHVSGLEQGGASPGGDPSPWTALGVFHAMEEAAQRKFSSGLRGLTVAVQGLGNVGSNLCDLLHAAGAKLVVADVRSGVAIAVAGRYNARILSPEAVLAAECDILAPCALGAVFNSETVGKVQAKIVCGAANNVLATEEDGYALEERGVLYCPDYVVNAGGIINVCAEYLGWRQDEVDARIKATGKRLGDILDFAEGNSLAAHVAADRLARAKIAGNSTKRFEAA
ncbi:Glu/Leu/Phe/Val dehydrogenase [Erythrobacteraceae bacterium E2-1 Yellow Sea]|nr:Glu/Leu/Phe/Val dehydrogenase [Erythrobacteraceae bacterium E2-1 Yellow Sea]